MNATELLENIGKTLRSTATVQSVYGEPIHAEGKTVVPVAKVAYGFGAGSGSRPGNRDTEGHRQAEGGGGGGGVTAWPAGVLEITRSGTRFIPFADMRRLASVFAAGCLFGGIGLHMWARRRGLPRAKTESSDR